MQKIVALLGGSAEYSIAVALILVCIIVGLAVWLLQPSKPVAAAKSNVAVQTAQARMSAAKTADEEAALGAWKERLEGGFDEMAQQQRRAEDDRARKEQQREEERYAEQVQPRPQPKEAPASAAKAPPPVKVLPKVVLPKPQAVRVESAIDWSSCKRPVYPEFSMRKGEQGAVTVDIDLDASAKVLRSRISESSGFKRLDVAAQRAIEKCSFFAATSNGVPQPSTAIVRFVWALQK